MCLYITQRRRQKPEWSWCLVRLLRRQKLTTSRSSEKRSEALATTIRLKVRQSVARWFHWTREAIHRSIGLLAPWLQVYTYETCCVINLWYTKLISFTFSHCTSEQLISLSFVYMCDSCAWHDIVQCYVSALSFHFSCNNWTTPSCGVTLVQPSRFQTPSKWKYLTVVEYSNVSQSEQIFVLMLLRNTQLVKTENTVVKLKWPN